MRKIAIFDCFSLVENFRDPFSAICLDLPQVFRRAESNATVRIFLRGREVWVIREIFKEGTIIKVATLVSMLSAMPVSVGGLTSTAHALGSSGGLRLVVSQIAKTLNQN